MSGSERLGPRELEDLLGQLRTATRPGERLRLASRIWELISSFSAEEQKTVLMELGIRNADRLQEALSRGRGSRVSVLLEFLDRQFRDLAVQRIAPAPVSPRKPVIDLRRAEARAEEVPNSFDEPAEEETGRESAPADEARARGAKAADEQPEDQEVPVEEDLRGVPTPGNGEEDTQSAGPAGETADRRPAVEEGEPALPKEEVDEETTPPGQPLEEIHRRLNRLRANWMKRRFLIDRIRLGDGDEDPEAMIRLVAEAGLSPQSYYWVVTEMTARGNFGPAAMALGIELAPDELAARQLQRRFDRRSDQPD